MGRGSSPGSGAVDAHEEGPAPVQSDPGTAEATDVDPERAELLAERDFCLQSIRDLDAEHRAGDLDDTDYEELRDAYTARAAAVLRTLAGDRPPDASRDGESAADDGDPGAEGAGPTVDQGGNPRRPADGPMGRRPRPPWKRGALVAGGIVVAAALAGWAVDASSGTRLPGQPVSGQALGAETVEKYITAAETASGKGDYLTAVKDYQKVLDSEPNQPEALTGEGWVLAETQQPALLQKGLTLLAAAEKAAPTYTPAHVYRGIALLSEGDYAGAIPELQWYLAHQPDPQLEGRVRQALQEAEAKAGAEGPAPTTSTTGPTSTTHR